MNTYTVTYADAHSHSFQVAGIPANSKQQAVSNLDAMLAAEPAALQTLVTTDTWTITVTQP